MSFQNQIPDDSQAMISIIELLRCGDYNFAIGQSAGEPHKEKICAQSIIPQNAGKSEEIENVLQFVSGQNRMLSEI